MVCSRTQEKAYRAWSTVNRARLAQGEGLRRATRCRASRFMLRMLEEQWKPTPSSPWGMGAMRAFRLLSIGGLYWPAQLVQSRDPKGLGAEQDGGEMSSEGPRCTAHSRTLPELGGHMPVSRLHSPGP